MSNSSLTLVCPKTKKPLYRVVSDLLASVNDLCRKKRVVDVSGNVVEGPLSAIWFDESGRTFYPERQQIPILLPGNKIESANCFDRQLMQRLKEENLTWNKVSPN